MKVILAPTDFSKTSLNAVNYAADMAVAIKAQLVLLNVVPVEVISEASVYPSQPEEDAFEYMKHKMQLLKNKLERRTKKEVQIFPNVIQGNIKGTIQEVSENKKPFVVIVGSNDKTGAQRFLLGSVALHTAKHSAFPVLIIPEKAKFKSVASIAFVSDLYFENATMVIKTLKEWLKVFQARLHVVNINLTEDFKSDRTSDFDALKKHMRNYDVYFNYIIDSSVPDGIFNYVKENKPDIVVLMYHKKALLHRLTYRSEFKNIVLHTSVPLLIISN
jgi:nucleotide-binding universal stress UspA family protein